MSSLARLQRGFRDYVLAGDARRIRPLVATPPEPLRRLGIYGGAYRLRLKEALAVDFTLLAAWLGEAGFDTVMDGYIDRHPSRDYNIRRYGHRMPEFLAETAPWRDEPLLAELAGFEWVQGLSFDAADAGAVDENRVAAIPPEEWAGLRFRFHPSVHRRDLMSNVHELWSALQEGRPLPEPRREGAVRHWLFWRSGGRNAYASLDAPQAAAFDAARAGADFATVCEVLCEWYEPETVPRQAAAELKGWLQEGMVVEVRREPFD